MHNTWRFAALAFGAVVYASPAVSQPTAFTAAVQELTALDSASLEARRATVGRLRTALDVWDRRLDDAIMQIRRDVASVSPARAAAMHLDLGRALAARGRTAEAVREFESAAARLPTSSEAQVWRALALDAAGRPSEAAQAFVSAWTLDTNSLVKAYYVAQRAEAAAPTERARARAALADGYARLELGSPTGAAVSFAVLGAIPDTMASAPIVGDTTTAAAFMLFASGRLDEGVAALERAGAGDASPRDRFTRAQRHEAGGRVTEARHDYEAAVAGALAGRSRLWIAIGRLADVDGDSAGATAAFEQAVRLSPNDPQMRRQLADTYASNGRSDEALAELMAARLVAPRDAPTHAAIGTVFLDVGRPADAVRALMRALELLPERYQTRYTLARAFDALGRADDAARERALFEKARLASLAERRRGMATDIEKEETVRRQESLQGGKK
jgi:tetratricopeptide (TPR) repeat protein